MTMDTQSDAPRQAPVKCLLVDDIDENLVALEALLKRDDVEVLKAHSGLEALELMLAHDVALAFLDVQMPDMDGFELAELIRGSERTRHVPLIFVTAGARNQLRLFKGYETGAVDFLYKPIDPYVLTSKANVFFELHRQKRALGRELNERTETLRLNEMFMAVLGHDLRNPLSAIVSSAYLLQRTTTEPEEVEKLAGRILSSAQRMGSMIEDMLDVARARLAGGIILKPAPMDLGEVVQRVIQEHQAGYPECRLSFDMGGDLHGEWDEARLAQITSNLITNAFQHGECDSEVDVRLDGRERDAVLLTVANKGGIPPELLEHIFDPFRGRDRAGGREQGLGLGLYIVRQIVLAHKGSIDVDSNSRTVFRVKLPRHGAEAMSAFTA